MKLNSSLFLLLVPLGSMAQDSAQKTTLHGYLKEMPIMNSTNLTGQSTVTNLLHHRLNISWNPSERLEIRAALRTRYYVGGMVPVNPDFKKQLTETDQNPALGWMLLDNKNSMLYMNIDRLSVEWRKKRWNVRGGRQRINWGINPIWNPNDLFNTYNFLDFDYEERPGSDAIRVRHVFNECTQMEAALTSSRTGPIAAGRYFINRKGYDVQFIAGYYRDVFTGGLGWAGNIGSFGFKGECQYYAAGAGNPGQLIVNLNFDRILKGNAYLSTGLLYNQAGKNESLGMLPENTFTVNPRMPMPGKWSAAVSFNKEWNPLLQTSLHVVGSPGIRMLLVYPMVRYNWKRNLDIDFTVQSYFMEAKTPPTAAHTFFLRLKCSF